MGAVNKALSDVKEAAKSAAGELTSSEQKLINADMTQSESKSAADARANKTISTSRKEETNKTDTSNEEDETSLDVELPGIKLPDIVNKKTDTVDPISAMSGLVDIISELPSFPQKMLKIFPGQLPIAKWTKKLTQMQKDVQDWITDLMDEQQELMELDVGLDAKMLNASSDTLNKLNNSKKKIKEKEGIIKKITNTLKAVIKVIAKVIGKISELSAKMVTYALTKVAEVCHIPPEWTEWLTEWTAGLLAKFALGAVEPPIPDPDALAAWNIKNTMVGFYESAYNKFKQVAKAVQTKIDEINAITAHPRLSSFSFAFWEDIPVEQLKTKSVSSLVPESMKDTVKEIIDASKELETEYKDAKKEMRDAIQKTKSEVADTSSAVQKELTSII